MKIELSDLRACPYQTREAEKIASGCDGIVCRISDDLVAKMLFGESDKEYREGNGAFRVGQVGDLVCEYKVAKVSQDEEVDVAAPVGVFKVEFRGEERATYVMNYLDGVRLDSVCSTATRVEDREDNTVVSLEKYAEIVKKYDGNIGKIRELGFYIEDPGHSNAMWNPENGKVHLFDFSRVYPGNHSIIDTGDKRAEKLVERLARVEVVI